MGAGEASLLKPESANDAASTPASESNAIVIRVDEPEQVVVGEDLEDPSEDSGGALKEADEEIMPLEDDVI